MQLSASHWLPSPFWKSSHVVVFMQHSLCIVCILTLNVYSLTWINLYPNGVGLLSDSRGIHCSQYTPFSSLYASPRMTMVKATLWRTSWHLICPQLCALSILAAIRSRARLQDAAAWPSFYTALTWLLESSSLVSEQSALHKRTLGHGHNL